LRTSREAIPSGSVMFDLEILFATIPVVLFGKGAY
jgi:lipopolysaccharide/colanic/teichoic acid biosynthesis glycosyltransferase